MLYSNYNYSFPNHLRTYQLFHEGDNIRAEFKIPGIKKKNISLSFSEEDRGVYVEIKDDITYFIPVQTPIHQDNITASLDLGILTVTMIKKNTKHSIQIK